MIYLFLADGFEEVEALAPLDILRRAGETVQTVGVSGKIVTGSHGIPVTADVNLQEITSENLRGVILPGGMPGTKNLENCNLLKKMLEDAVRQNCMIGAICAAPSILGKRGMLQGKKATCFPGFEETLYGATVVDEPAVIDGNIVTARGAGAALEFGFALLQLLQGKEKAENMRKIMRSL